MSAPDRAPNSDPIRDPGHSSGIRRTAVASAVLLFLECALIRWTASELGGLAFFKNLTLIAAFLGAGLGLSAGARLGWLRWLTWPLVILVTVSLPVLPGTPLLEGLHLGGTGEFHWNLQGAASLVDSLGYLTFFAVVVVTMLALFVGAGAVVGRELESLPPLPGYIWNLVGSVAGSAAFAVASMLHLPPAAWIAIVAVPLALLLCEGLRAALVAGTVLCAAAIAAYMGGGATWSLYSRLALAQDAQAANGRGPEWTLSVDHAYFMHALDLRPRGAEDPLHEYARLHYDLPYRLSPAPARVLVLGAGMGNDVAAALRHGAERVDAVEIDGEIVTDGRRLHPERPYDSPRVRVVVDDARSFLTRSRDTYDLIVVGLLDSHVLLSRMPGVRLDNYVYTVESVRQMASHLSPAGLVCLSFAVRPDHLWLGYKLDRLLTTALGQEPLAFGPRYDASFMLFGGPGLRAPSVQNAALDRSLDAIRVDPAALAARVTGGGYRIAVPTDDWPHLYLRDRELPASQILLLCALLPICLVATRLLVPVAGWPEPSFFLLGAGFLLVETKGIADLGLLFGGTWWTVNAVLTAALAMALAATLFVAARPPMRVGAWVAALVGVLLSTAFVRPGMLLTLPLWLGRTAGAALVALPVFFSGVIFASLFRRVDSPSRALGSNLLGAVLGGFLEYASLAWGIRSLSLLAAGLYALTGLLLAGRTRLGAGRP